MNSTKPRPYDTIAPQSVAFVGLGSDVTLWGRASNGAALFHILVRVALRVST